MADDIAVDIGRLRESGRQLQRLGEDVAGRQGAWRSSVQGSAAAWGADEEGSTFGSAYQEAADAAGDLFAELAQALDTIGSNLTVMADNLSGADESNQSRLLGIAQRLGGYA